MDVSVVLEHIKALGATHCQVASPKLLVPEGRIRQFCLENKCGCFGKHLMCPPHVGGLGKIKRRFDAFDDGILIQYAVELDIRKDSKGLAASKRVLHRIVLETERYLCREAGAPSVLGMIGGDCALCDTCAGFKGEPCLFPEQARPSLEAMAVDVLALLNALGLDAGFYADRVTWTGVVLFNAAHPLWLRLECRRVDTGKLMSIR